jgi:hypothetical protein
MARELRLVGAGERVIYTIMMEELVATANALQLTEIATSYRALTPGTCKESIYKNDCVTSISLM